MEVPDGWVVVPRGGRPPKHARNVAVFLAVQWREEREREKRHQAIAWAAAHWQELGDDRSVKRAVAKAKKAFGRCGIVVNADTFSMIVDSDRASWPAPALAGASGWLWGVGEREAVRVRASAVSRSAPHTGGVAETVSATG